MDDNVRARIEELEKELRELKRKQTGLEERHIRIQHSKDGGCYSLRITDRLVNSKGEPNKYLSRFKTIAHRDTITEAVLLLREWSEDALNLANSLERGGFE